MWFSRSRTLRFGSGGRKGLKGFGSVYLGVALAGLC